MGRNSMCSCPFHASAETRLGLYTRPCLVVSSGQAIPGQCLSCRTSSTLSQLGWKTESRDWDSLAAVKICCVPKTSPSTEAESGNQYGRVITAILTLLLLLLALFKAAHKEKAPKLGLHSLVKLCSSLWVVCLQLFSSFKTWKKHFISASWEGVWRCKTKIPLYFIKEWRSIKDISLAFTSAAIYFGFEINEKWFVIRFQLWYTKESSLSWPPLG